MTVPQKALIDRQSGPIRMRILCAARAACHENLKMVCSMVV